MTPAHLNLINTVSQYKSIIERKGSI